MGLEAKTDLFRGKMMKCGRGNFAVYAICALGFLRRFRRVERSARGGGVAHRAPPPQWSWRFHWGTQGSSPEARNPGLEGATPLALERKGFRTVRLGLK